MFPSYHMYQRGVCRVDRYITLEWKLGNVSGSDDSAIFTSTRRTSAEHVNNIIHKEDCVIISKPSERTVR